jgi:glycosyltransferase involved in cell wall biosynthesis
MISVIIPTHNSEKTIYRAIRSVQSQNIENEIIVCDDGSTDNTLSICREADFTRIIARETCTGGPNWGRNVGLDSMVGNWFCFLDHDDELTPGALSVLRAAPEADIIFGEHWFVKCEGGSVRLPVLRGYGDGEIVRFRKNELFKRILAQDKRNFCVPYLSGMLVKKETVSESRIRFEENFGMMDYDFMLKLTEGRTAVKINTPVMTRYSDGGNLSLDPHFRRVSYYFSLMTMELYYKKYSKEVLRGMGRISGTKGRYHYLMGEMGLARMFFLRSRLCLKTVLFLGTSYLIPASRFVRKKIRILGT